jgi:hypothetical protein
MNQYLMMANLLFKVNLFKSICVYTQAVVRGLYSALLWHLLESYSVSDVFQKCNNFLHIGLLYI